MALPAVAEAAAVTVMLCAMPGVRVSVNGCAVTPVGSPVIATATVLLKELTAVAVTLTWEPVAPAVRAREVGDAVKVKSGGGGGAEIVAAMVAEWLSVPEVPVSVRVALPATAVAAAVIVTFCAVPGVNVRVAGCAVTPVGSPVMATATMPVNPFAEVAFTLICCPAPPGTSVIDAGVGAREKSASDAGLDPPPQEIAARQKRLKQILSTFEKGRISTLQVDAGITFPFIFRSHDVRMKVYLFSQMICNKVVSNLVNAESSGPVPRMGCRHSYDW